MLRLSRSPVMWALLAFLWTGSNVAAQERLFAVDGARNNPSTLYELDRADGSVIATIGPTGFRHVAAIDFDPTTGVLYGILNGPGPAVTLITIDPDTGAGTLVAPVAFPPEPPCLLPIPVFDRVPDMSINSLGVLVVWREPCEDDLYTVDKVTGVTTLVGESGIPGGPPAFWQRARPDSRSIRRTRST